MRSSITANITNTCNFICFCEVIESVLYSKAKNRPTRKVSVGFLYNEKDLKLKKAKMVNNNIYRCAYNY